MRNAILAVAALGALNVVAGTVAKTVIRQNWPYDPTVTIDYELAGELDERCDMEVGLEDANGPIEGYANAFSGDLDGVKPGEHRIVWDPVKAGYENAAATSLKVTLTPRTSAAKYLVIEGLDTGSLTVTPLNDEPSGGFNTDTYKKTKIVLRHIRAGRFRMGSPETEGGRNANENPHDVILTNDYWIGVFQLTRRQWLYIKKDVTPTDHYSDSMTPAIGISWNHICGENASKKAGDVSTDVDEGSFLGLLGAKINAQLPPGYVVALPSEAQWEYACRAGTETAWNNGTDYNVYQKTATSGTYAGNTYWVDDNLTLLARYVWTTRGVSGGNNATKVGSFLPNAWGLYDCHGGANELVFDTIYVDGGGKGPDTTQVEQRICNLPNYRIIKGGTWNSNPAACRSATRSHASRTTASSEYGFRIAIIKEVK